MKNKARLFIALSAFITFLWDNQLAFSQKSENKVEGSWYAEEMDKSSIKIYKENEAWFARIIKSHNPKVVGKIIFVKGTYDPASQEYVGILINPENGMEVNATIHLKNDKTLMVVGKKLFFTKTFYWKKE
jgi:hypothetical protein